MRADAQAHSVCGTPCVTHQEFLRGARSSRRGGWCSLLEEGGGWSVPGATVFACIVLSGQALEGWLRWEVTGEDGVRDRV